MRHRVPRNRLGRPSDQRNAVLRSLATELLRHDEITTTLPKAKAVVRSVETIITKAKRGALPAKGGSADARARSIHLRRQVASYIHDSEVVKKVFEVTAPRYKDRQGGYTRIIKAGVRRGDAAPMAIIQLV